jgi:hypothetical protein
MSSEIKVDTISENTSANGVAIDSLGIKDGKITNLMNATLSAADLGTGIHIKTGDSSVSSLSVSHDELIVESDGNAGISILGGTSNQVGIAFGDSGDSDVGRINYTHSDNVMRFINNGSENMTINTDGEVTKPLQPCFRVGSGTQNNIAVSSNVNAIFNVEIFDIGNNFGSSTFTAPVTGKYYLGLLMRLNAVDSASSYIQIVIVGSNRSTTVFTFHNATELSADADNVTVSGSTVLDMDANDTAYVRIRIQSGTAQTDVDADGSYFTGYLIG